jgi:aryl-alcohol dehydrogenase-like predicted oxidoreductase
LRYRPFGDEAIGVSEVSFGTGDDAGVMVHGSSHQQRDIIGAALDAGVNLFDSSPAYGKGAAEVNLGRVLRELSAADVFVMTKAFVHAHDRARIQEAIPKA